MDKIALYIHIPFCVSKCSYCAFCSFVPKQNEMEKYVEHLIKEIELVSKDCLKPVFSIYVGGGTPSILPSGCLKRIFDSIRNNFTILKDASITIEANPNSFSLHKAKEYKKCGCNRVSFGLQSADADVLKLLNRAHTYSDCVQAVNNACHVGITDINVDILLGVPTQNFDILKDTLEKIVTLPIMHVSAYGLIIEPKTKLAKQIGDGEVVLPSEDVAVDMYDYVVEYLKNHGFSRYEISNFAKPGYQSVHNNNYWARGQYLGLGLAAYSFIDGVHFENISDLASYFAKLDRGEDCRINFEPETAKTAQEETIMLALRTDKGLDISAFNKKFNVDFEKKYEMVLEKLLKDSLVKIENGFLRIVDMYISNSIIAEFFD